MQKTVRTCGVRLKNRAERNEELRDAAFVIVAGVDNYSDAVRRRRAADVEAAFPPAGPLSKAAASVKTAGTKPATKNTVAKSSAKVTSKTSTMKTTAKKSVVKAATAKASAVKTVSKSSAMAKSAVASTAKPASKGPTPAGMSVGPHDGDVC